MIEAAMVTPALILLWLFLIDFFMYSKAQTLVTQVIRDGAIFLATAPGNMTESSHNNLQNSTSLLMLCDTDPSDVDCAHVIAHYRIAMMLNSQVNNNLDTSSLNITSDRTGNNVTIQVSIPLTQLFFTSEYNITRSATLRRVGS